MAADGANWRGGALALSGVAMSTFASSVLPEGLQQIGFWAGALIGLAGVSDIVRERVVVWRAKLPATQETLTEKEMAARGIKTLAFLGIGLFLFGCSSLGWMAFILYTQPSWINPHPVSEKWQSQVTAKPAVHPMPPRATATPTAKRIFLNQGPVALLKQYVGLTSVQASRLFELNRGKWMAVTGAVYDEIGPQDGGSYYVLLDVVPKPYGLGCSFQKQWADTVTALRRGDQIRVVGKVERFEGPTLMLEDCELSSR